MVSSFPLPKDDGDANDVAFRGILSGSPDSVTVHAVAHFSIPPFSLSLCAIPSQKNSRVPFSGNWAERWNKHVSFVLKSGFPRVLQDKSTSHLENSVNSLILTSSALIASPNFTFCPFLLPNFCWNRSLIDVFFLFIFILVEYRVGEVR